MLKHTIYFVVAISSNLEITTILLKILCEHEIKISKSIEMKVENEIDWLKNYVGFECTQN